MEIVGAQLSCFVIGPIGDKNAEIGGAARIVWETNIQTWEEIIQPACIGVGIIPLRADHINEAGDITDQIFRKLRDSHVVIADLTAANPNVMYELGLRHTTGKLTIQIGEVGQLPFDINTIRTIMFRRTLGGMVIARRALAEALAAGIEGRFSPNSATRIWLEVPGDGGVPTPEMAPADNVEELGYLEMLADLDSGRADMIATLSAMGNVIREIGTCTSESAEAINAAGGPNSTVQARIEISNKLAERISDPASRLEALAKTYVDSVNKSDAGTKYLVAQLKKQPEDESTATTLRTLEDFFMKLLEGFDSASGYGETIAASGNPTKAQGKQYNRILAAINHQTSVRPVVEQWLQLVKAAQS